MLVRYINVKIFIFIILILSVSHSSDLVYEYKKMMNSSEIEAIIKNQTKNLTEKKLIKKYKELAKSTMPKLTDGSIDTNSKEFQDLIEKYSRERRTYQKKPQDISQKTPIQQYDYVGSIQKIMALKQDTFESSREFNTRQDRAISELKDKIQSFARKGSKKYSAGTATMKNYDADKERMRLSLTWNKDIQSSFPSSKIFKNVSLNISREEAKNIFQKQRTHNFHIEVSFINNKITISKMKLYDKFKLYASTVYSPKEKTDNSQQSHIPFQQYTSTLKYSTAPSIQRNSSCQNYIVTASQLNIRSSPKKDDNIIGILLKHNTVCIFNFWGKWGKFNLGWVSKKHLVPKNRYSIKKIGIVYGLDPNADGFLSIRRKPNSREIGKLYNGNKVEILSKRGKWYKIRTLNSGLVGWSCNKWIITQ